MRTLICHQNLLCDFAEFFDKDNITHLKTNSSITGLIKEPLCGV